MYQSDWVVVERTVSSNAVPEQVRAAPEEILLESTHVPWHHQHQRRC
jgi:hypothetical protein